MVLHIVSSFVGLIKVRLHTKIDSTVFRLHYRWATSFCFLSCALVSATEYIGYAIKCIASGDDPSPKAINTYCWISSTHTLTSEATNGSAYQSRGISHSGIGKYDPEKHDIIYHKYYQWVAFFLFFQGCLFYVPHLIWKTIEGKTAENLLQGLQFNSMDEEREKKRENIVKYLKVSRGHNVHYAITYLLCEVLNLVNVIGQMMLLDKFLGGAFLEYGLKLYDPTTLVRTFPRMTKCPFNFYGPNGELFKEEYLCILPQNVLNEKIFIGMWFLFIILATITAVEVVWRITVAVSPLVRVHTIERRGKLTSDPKLERVIRCMYLGDYCLLSFLGDNLDASNFKALLLSLADSHDNSIHPNGDPTYRPYSHLDEVDGDGIVEARV